MKLPSKAELAAKLLEYPMLRLLLYERWFRVAVAGLLLLVVFLALFLPKIWRTSEPDFRPVIKVSGLDLLQAWSLKRTALKAGAARKFDDASYAWQAALANNQADPELVRGALRTFLADPRPPEKRSHAIPQAYWLLSLTGTNMADLELSARVLAKAGYDGPIVSLVAPKVDEVTPGLAGTYLKALFHERRMAEFDANWAKLSAKVQNDPELQLYRAAFLAGWGPPDQSAEARRQLEASTQDPARQILAHRLKLAVCARELKPDEYARSLRKLEEAREDAVSHHAVYWRLLNTAGQIEEARRLATAYSGVPKSSADLVELAQVSSELGLRDQAIEILQRHASDFDNSVMFWVAYANELAVAKRWDDLRTCAVQIRNQEGVRDQLGGFSYFIEGRAELALGRQAVAKEAFQKTAKHEFPFPMLGQNVASELLDFGFAAEARAILLGLEKHLNKDPGYWFLLFSAADRLKDIDLLLQAATHGYELNPQNPIAINNYAAALIISRQNPREAIKLTLQLITQNPNSLHAVVNHSAALLLNQRAKEAETLLSRVRTNALNRAQLALFHLDLFEAYAGLKEFDRAWAVSDQIESAWLYPTQRKWLEETRKTLPPRKGSG